METKYFLMVDETDEDREIVVEAESLDEAFEIAEGVGGMNDALFGGELTEEEVDEGGWEVY